MVPLKYLSHFWRTLKMSLINCEIRIQLKCSTECVLIAGIAPNQVPIFTKTDTKLYVPVVTLSTQDNVILLKQLESSFKRTMNWNKCQSKKTNQVQNRYLYFLIDPSFQGVNRLFVLSFENEDDWKSCNRYYLSTVGMKMTVLWSMEKMFFDQLVKNDL